MSSAYEYRRIGRGGQGVTNIDNIKRNGPVVASFASTKGDQLMLVTDQAKLIRMPLESLRVIGRGSAGVRLFNVDDNEHVVSAARIQESEADGGTDEDVDAAADDVNVVVIDADVEASDAPDENNDRDSDKEGDDETAD
jgi:DNA gyrase subunit A